MRQLPALRVHASATRWGSPVPPNWRSIIASRRRRPAGAHTRSMGVSIEPDGSPAIAVVSDNVPSLTREALRGPPFRVDRVDQLLPPLEPLRMYIFPRDRNTSTSSMGYEVYIRDANRAVPRAISGLCEALALGGSGHQFWSGRSRASSAKQYTTALPLRVSLCIARWLLIPERRSRLVNPGAPPWLIAVHTAERP